MDLDLSEIRIRILNELQKTCQKHNGWRKEDVLL